MSYYAGPTTHLGERYELKSQAGTGGMGTVFQAYDRKTRQIVAVKVLHSKGDTDAARFEREAELLSELNHPAVVRFIDYGTTSHGEPYYVMEWLDGETLDERLRRGCLSPSLVARLGARVAEALSVAHHKGVIHRDIKPSNIYLSGYRVGDAKLIDFGVARRTDDAFRLTKRGNTVGTPMYNAPEQARGLGDLDGRVDIFALGCVLFEALTGEPAFQGDSAGHVMTLIASGQGPDVERKLAGVDSELRVVVGAMLSNRRDERPADAAGLAARFGKIADRLAPLEAPTPSPSTAVARRTGRDLISHSEQRVMSVLVLARLRQTLELAAASFNPPRPTSLGDDLVHALIALLEPLGGRVDRLLDRSVIITAPALSSVTEQTEQIARMGLAIVAAHPDLSVAMATGRGVLLARLPAGEVIEQCSVLLEGARPGAVVMDDTSARLIGAHFALLHERGQHKLVAECDMGPAPRRILGEITPFAGRERELSALTSVLAECSADDVSHAVILAAPAGLGKSRLAAEWFRRMQMVAEDVLIVRSRAKPGVGANDPYRALWGFFEAAAVPVQDRETSAGAAQLATWLHTQCHKQTVVALLEDAHLADSSSLQLLDNLLMQLATVPFLVVVTARPELNERVPDLFDKHAPLRLRLPLLARRHADHALRGLLPASRTDLDQWILDRARGNPFCLEELARHALLPGRAALPDTVAALVQSELDALGKEGKRVLRAASVYGHKFTAPAIAALLSEAPDPQIDEVLQELVERGFLQHVPEDGEGPWQFCETIVREVAYGSLPAGDRALARRLARAYLSRVGKAVPASLKPGDSRVEATPSQLPALAFLARP